MKRSRFLLLGGTTLSSLLMLPSCAEPSNSSAAGDGTGTVRFLAAEDPATFEPVIAAFIDENPAIDVEYTQVPFDQYSSTLQQRLSAGDDTIDVFGVDQPHLAQIAAQGFLEPLDGLKDRAEAVTSPAQYAVNLYDGVLYALPVWNSTQLLYVNRDALADAGVEAPSSDPRSRWAWGQVVEAGVRAQEAGIESGVLLEQVESYYQLQALIESAGGGSGITGDDMLTPDIQNAGWIDALTWYADTFDSGLSPRGVGGFETAPAFADGTVAFFVGGPWNVGRFATDARFDWVIAPQPYFDGGEAVTPTGSWSWGVNTASKNKAAARTFLEFAALDAAGNLATTEAQTIIPAQAEAAEEYLPGLEELGGRNAVGVADLINHEVVETARARPVSVGYVQFESLINRALADIRNGSVVEERLALATEQIEDAWSHLR